MSKYARHHLHPLRHTITKRQFQPAQQNLLGWRPSLLETEKKDKEERSNTKNVFRNRGHRDSNGAIGRYEWGAPASSLEAKLASRGARRKSTRQALGNGCPIRLKSVDVRVSFFSLDDVLKHIHEADMRCMAECQYDAFDLCF